MARMSFGKIILVIILGALIGSLVGQLIGLVLPSGVVKDFFLKSSVLAVGPTPVEVGLFSLTLGFSVTLNIVGLVGIGVALYLLRWY